MLRLLEIRNAGKQELSKAILGAFSQEEELYIIHLKEEVGNPTRSCTKPWEMMIQSTMAPKQPQRHITKRPPAPYTTYSRMGGVGLLI